MLPLEEDPCRCCQPKRFKIKAMFMGVTFRPLHDSQRNLIDDGKFSIFPLVKKVAEKKTSKNKVAGTIETKPIERITQEVIRGVIINQVLPAIMQNWPTGLSKKKSFNWPTGLSKKIWPIALSNLAIFFNKQDTITFKLRDSAIMINPT